MYENKCFNLLSNMVCIGSISYGSKRGGTSFHKLYYFVCFSQREASPSLTICYVRLRCNVEPPYNLISIYSIQPMHPNFPHIIKQYLVKPYQHKKIYVSITKLSLIHARIVYRFEVLFGVKWHTIAISSFLHWDWYSTSWKRSYL
jgi:hypothetical protein